jgi:hypothetical protein
MSKEQTRILQLKRKIAEHKDERDILLKALTLQNNDIYDFENELSILEKGGTIKDVQKWKDKNHSQ